jgi:hypothetical protein
LRPRFAALGLVGGAMVCLPLLQLLQYQSTELEWAQAQRAALDPAAEAVAVQRRLLAHRDAAGRVLRGREEQEPERRTRQAEVDTQLTRLQQALEEGHWGLPQEEARRLGQDWALLAHQVTQREISADTSDGEHRLRVEQVLQVLDLVSLAALGPLPSGGAPDGGATAAPLAQHAHAPAALGPAWALPQVALQWSTLSAGSDAATLRAAQRALQQQLQALQVTAGQDAALAAAAARADARSRRWLTQLAASSDAAAGPMAREAGQGLARGATSQAAATAAEPQDALRSAALQAVFDLQASAGSRSREALEARLQAVQWQRSGTLAALAALAVAWCALLIALQVELRRRLRPATPPPGPAPSRARQGTGRPAPRAESAPVTERLIRRLQDGDAAAAPVRPARSRTRDAQPSLPPEA